MHSFYMYRCVIGLIECSLCRKDTVQICEKMLNNLGQYGKCLFGSEILNLKLKRRPSKWSYSTGQFHGGLSIRGAHFVFDWYFTKFRGAQKMSGEMACGIFRS